MAIRTEYKELALYTDGNMVKIATGTYFVASFPRGEIVARPYNTNVGFVFQSLRTNELIAIVTDYTQVKDATGTPYPGTFDQVLTTINGILDTTGGGGGGGGDATAANQVIMIGELQDINTELDTQTGLLGSILDKSSIAPSNVIITNDVIFKPQTREIEFNKLPVGFNTCDLLAVLNYTRSEVIFDPFVSGKSGTFLGSVLKVNYDTTSMQQFDIICAYLVDNTQIILLNKIFETLDTLTTETKRQNAITNHILTS
jgi:hypothetical protein